MESAHKATVLEVNLISAQDLLPTCKSSGMQTYVVAWINPQQKVSSRIDKAGSENPTWNDKFIFGIEGSTAFGSGNSILVFEIYRVRRFRKDKRIGIVRVFLDDLIDENHGCDEGGSGKFMAFLDRRPSGTPQGILNIGVMCLDGLRHDQAMPGFLGSSCLAIDHRTLMGR